MAEPLPKNNRCQRCGEWFHNAHACQVGAADAGRSPAMSDKPEALRLVEEYAQEVKDFGYVEHSLARAKLENHLAALHAECEALRADALRYRWLRDPRNADRDEWNSFGPYSTAQEIDAAIDAAMSKDQTK